MAFQLVDDVLDFTAREKTLGKPVGGDLREGKVTLPLVYALERASPAERRLVDTILRERNYEEVPFERDSGPARKVSWDRARAGTRPGIHRKSPRDHLRISRIALSARAHVRDRTGNRTRPLSREGNQKANPTASPNTERGS